MGSEGERNMWMELGRMSEWEDRSIVDGVVDRDSVCSCPKSQISGAVLVIIVLCWLHDLLCVRFLAQCLEQSRHSLCSRLLLLTIIIFIIVNQMSTIKFAAGSILPT